MNVRIKRGICALTSVVCSLVLFLSSSFVLANEVDDLENQTTILQKELDELNQDLVAIADQILETEQIIYLTSGAIYRSTYQLSEAEIAKDIQMESMHARIRFMYEVGNASLFEVLFSAENMTDFLNAAEFIQTVNEHDRRMLQKLQDTYDGIALLHLELGLQYDAYVEKQNSLEEYQAELAAKAEATATDLDAFLAQLEQARAAEAARLAEAARQAELQRIAEAEAVAAAEAEAVAAAEAAATATPPTGNETVTDNPPPPNNNSSGNGNETPAQTPPDETVAPPPPAESVDVSSCDLTLFAAILEAEAFVNYHYMLAVATVILNRVADPRFPGTVRDVIHQPGQFEPVRTGRLNTIINRGPHPVAFEAAGAALNGARVESLHGYFFFLAAWSTNREGQNIGGNLFFRSW